MRKKIILITGASSGIGAACARMLADNTRVIIVNYRKSERDANKVLQDILKKGAEGITIQADVAKRSEVLKLVDRIIKKFGTIDVLVNNAGSVFKPAGWEEVSEKDFSLTVAVNLYGVFNCIRMIAPVMKKNRYGRIINIASLAAFSGSLNAPAYSAAKAGVISLTRGFAKELAPYNITVNAIAPSWVNTRWHQKKPKAFFDMVKRMVPMGRIAEPEDIASTVSFFISEESQYITGQTLIVAGGMSTE